MNEKALSLAEPGAMAELTRAQETQVTQLTQLCGQMAQLVYTMDARIASLEKTMKTRVTISYAQSSALLRAAQKQAKALCDLHGLPNTKAGKPLRAALWRDFRREYNVGNRADLPAMFYEDALAFVEGWTSFAAIRRIRERLEP